jgi:hypothetical protein
MSDDLDDHLSLGKSNTAPFGLAFTTINPAQCSASAAINVGRLSNSRNAAVVQGAGAEFASRLPPSC